MSAAPDSPRALPWLGLAGPTASGKSALALALAESHPIEIVSVDSALVYRQMDIGSAKPSLAERARVTHHLIDLIDPLESYSAARFVRDAQAAIAAAHRRGRLPLLVGGTMLYFKALIDGLDEIPQASAAQREQLQERARLEGWPALHAELARVDPTCAARLSVNDAQRIGRALEVFYSTGLPLSRWQGQRAPGRGVPHTLFSLEPVERGWLHRRIEARFAAMLRAGLVDEVRRLQARGDLHAALPSMRCVGYRQTWHWLDTAAAADSGCDLLHAWGSAATRQLAKRQLTWLRGWPTRRVLACDAPRALDEGRKLLLEEASRLSSGTPA